MSTQGQVTAEDIERVIGSLISITSARVVIARTGDIEEIHVLANSGRAPKQIVRDIESSLVATFGIRPDHKKISVAQTQNGRQFKFNESRLRFSDVSISLNGTKSEAVVRLHRGGDKYTGTANGHSSGFNQLRLIATSTLRAIENGQSADGTLVLEDITTEVRLRGFDIVVVCVSHITPRGEEFLTGSAIVKQDLYKAVVNATLDAVNRRLGSIGDR